MKTPSRLLILGLLVVAVSGVLFLKHHQAQSVPGVPAGAEKPSLNVGGSPNAGALPRLVDLGAGKCIPCRQMVPILEQLRQEYAGRLEVEVHDISRSPEAAQAFRVGVIPTQIFFDANGKELFRHEGFFAKEEILEKWKELGVSLGEKATAEPHP